MCRGAASGTHCRMNTGEPMHERFSSQHDEFMRLALDEAERAPEHGDVPIGAVVVRRGEVLATAHQRFSAYLHDRPLPFYPWLRQHRVKRGQYPRGPRG